jgi:hypothetical protein
VRLHTEIASIQPTLLTCRGSTYKAHDVLVSSVQGANSSLGKVQGRVSCDAVHDIVVRVLQEGVCGDVFQGD